MYSKMLGGVKLLLLLVVLMELVPVTDPRGPGSSSRSNSRTRSRSISRAVSRPKSSPKLSCQEKIAACGEFPSSNGATNVHCRLNKKRCLVYCSFTCKKGMKRSTRRKDHYMCVGNEWKRPARGYCIADNFPVKEVRQASTKPDMMNELIKKLLTSSYEHLAMASFYKRADVALPGFVKLMSDLAGEDLKFARDVITYFTERGESLNLQDIDRPSAHEDLLLNLGKRTGQPGLERALTEARNANAYILEVINQARDTHDPHKKHFLEDGVLDFKVNTIKKLADLNHILVTFDDDEDYFVGEYRMDLELRE